MYSSQKVMIAVIAAATVFCVPALDAQQNGDSGPIPAQILSAKRVFIANAPGELELSSYEGPYWAYSQLYSALKTWGKIDLASEPANADLVFEVSMRSEGSLGFFEAVIVDPKTRVPLWWIAERVEVANRRKTADKNRNDAITKLSADIERLLVSAQTAAQ